MNVPAREAGDRGELRVALVTPVDRHLGRVLAVGRRLDEMIAAYYRDHFYDGIPNGGVRHGRALVPVGSAIRVGEIVSLSRAHVLRQGEIRIQP